MAQSQDEKETVVKAPPVDGTMRLASQENEAEEEKLGPIMASFLTMTLCFSLNHGTVTAVIPLATSQFGSDLGDISLGVLYSFYTLTALLGSTVIVGHLGHKWSLFMGCAVYSLYVLGMFLGVLTHNELRWVLVIGGSVFGGIAAGFLWTAQGGYFANAAKTHAAYKGIELSQATSQLSSIFAMVYLSLELVMKLLSSLVLVWVCEAHWSGSFIAGQCGYSHDGEYNKDTDFIKNLKFEGVVWTYATFSVIVVASAVGMAFIKSIKPFELTNTGASTLLLPKKPVQPTEPKPWYTKAMVAIQLIRAQPKIMLLGLINVEFGVASAYLNSYVTGTVIKDGLGDNKVGYFVSIIPLVATIVQKPLAQLAKSTGSKTPSMLLGNLCFLAFGSVFLITDLGWGDLPGNLGKWGILCPLFVVYGVARAVWEGANKAVVADMFKNDSEAAFAVLILQLGTTSSFAFILFRFLSSEVKEFIVVIVGILSVFGYFASIKMHKADLARAHSEASNPVDIQQA